MFNESTWVALMAMLGLLSATLFALFLRVDKGFLRAGLYSFSGFLAGGAVAHLSGRGDWDGGIVIPVMLTAMLTVIFFGTREGSENLNYLLTMAAFSRVCHVCHRSFWCLSPGCTLLDGGYLVATFMPSEWILPNYSMGAGRKHMGDIVRTHVVVLRTWLTPAFDL
jgi:hypothetical protein